MPSASDGQSASSWPHAGNSASEASDPEAADLIDLNQVYLLIDSILPFEACLYYQVLPLHIEGSRLVIGMVNPDDLTATEYVKKQLSYINYSLLFRRIDSDWHRDLLSKYLSYTAKHRSQPGAKAGPAAPAVTRSRSAATPPDPGTQNTFIVDRPDEIPEDRPAAPPAAVQPPASPSPTSTGAQPVAAASPSTVSGLPPLHLNVDEQYRSLNEAHLVRLPPKALMQALLSKVLEEGIGRLYFERRPQAGRILWSRDGVLQAVVESIEPQLFQSVINEFKLLTHLSLIAVKKTRQVEIERLYQGERLLLRFQVMPNTDGEEATLQVLRGTALKFYQQQQIDKQIDKLGRDALDAAQTLQKRLNEIRDRARETLNFRPTRSETLPAIVRILKQMERQIRDIVAAYDLQQGESASPSSKSDTTDSSETSGSRE